MVQDTRVGVLILGANNLSNLLNMPGEIARFSLELL